VVEIEETKVCKKCTAVKPVSLFSNAKHTKDEKQIYCKDCSRKINKQWKQDNPEKARANSRAQHAKHRGRYIESSRQWRADNPAKVQKFRKDFYAANPERNLVYEAKKRAKKRGTPFSITWKNITIPEFCPVLGIKLERGVGQLTDASPTLDAIVPALGYTPGNIAVISHRANRIKTDASLVELEAVAVWLRAKIAAAEPGYDPATA